MDYLTYLTPQKFDQLRQRFTSSLFTSTPNQRPRTIRCERLATPSHTQSWSPLTARRATSRIDTPRPLFITSGSISKKDNPFKTRARINVNSGKRFSPYNTSVRSATSADQPLSLGQSKGCDNEIQTDDQFEKVPCGIKKDKPLSFGQSPLKKKLEFPDLSLVVERGGIQIDKALLSESSGEQVQSVTNDKPLSFGQSPKDTSSQVDKIQGKKRVSFGQAEILNAQDFHTMSSVKKMRQNGRLGYCSGVCSTPISEKVVKNLDLSHESLKVKDESDSKDSVQETSPSGRPLTRVERITRLPPMPSSFGLIKSNSATEVGSKQPAAAADGEMQLRRCNSDESGQSSSKRVPSKKSLFKHFRM